jgi:hypothetical protein
VVATVTRLARGAAAGEQLTAALINAAAQGLRTPCSEPDTHHYWLSEDPAERKKAARWCRGCPVLHDCGAAAAARREAFGVWGGRDFTKRQRTNPAAADA